MSFELTEVGAPHVATLPTGSLEVCIAIRSVLGPLACCTALDDPPGWIGAPQPTRATVVARNAITNRLRVPSLSPPPLREGGTGLSPPPLRGRVREGGGPPNFHLLVIVGKHLGGCVRQRALGDPQLHAHLGGANPDRPR